MVVVPRAGIPCWDFPASWVARLEFLCQKLRQFPENLPLIVRISVATLSPWQQTRWLGLLGDIRIFNDFGDSCGLAGGGPDHYDIGPAGFPFVRPS